MTVQVPVRLTREDVAALDAVVARGRFRTRSEALRVALVRLLADERQAAIDDAYRRGYGEHPQEEWVGEAGLAAFAAFAAAERGDPP